MMNAQSLRATDTAALLLHVAGIHHEKGEYDKALSVYLQPLEISENCYSGKEHPVTGTILMNVGDVYSLKQDFDQALKYHQQFLHIKRKLSA
ncbi:unnamed protein product, partial [Didymodactylos carnosus]